MFFFLLALVPLCVPFIGKILFHKEITWPELALGIVISFGATAVLYYSGAHFELQDTEILNGVVIKKEKDRVGCRHSHTVCTKIGKTTTCRTWHEHLFDYDWNVHTTHNVIRINTIDRQGTKEPPRFTDVIIGEPVAVEHSYTNYVKGAKNSLFNLEKFSLTELNKLPEYPVVHDYYRINRVVNLGTKNLNNTKEINDELSRVLGKLGPQKQVNVVIVFAPEHKLYEELKIKWIGGKKNDVIVFIGSDSWPKIEWVEVLAWSKDKYVNVNIQENVFNMTDPGNPQELIGLISKDVTEHYKRRSMKDFEYLKDEIEPSSKVIWITLIVSLLFNIGLVWLFRREDVI